VTHAQIEALAPDQASNKNAMTIFNKTPWEVYRSDRALWSAIKGSGSRPYLCAMDISSIAFKCSCPSRKFPCKHGLALGFYLAHHTIEQIAAAEEPEWVKEWIDKRSAKAAAPKAPPKTQEQIEQKSLSRWESLQSDIEYIELFLSDAMKGGILEFANKDAAYWQNHAKAMVDKKIAGLNRYFNALASIDYGAATHREQILGVLTSLHLIVRAARSHDKISDEVRGELEQILGWNRTRQELLADTGAKMSEDRWHVVSIRYDELDNLTSRRVYLYGVESGSWALILDFSYNGIFEKLYMEGECFKAKLLYFGSLQPRAIVKVKGEKCAPDDVLNPLPDLTLAQERFNNARDTFPLLYEELAFVAELRVVQSGHSYLLVDTAGRYVPIESFGDEKYLKLLILTRGERFDGFVVKSAEGYRLLAIHYDQRTLSL